MLEGLVVLLVAYGLIQLIGAAVDLCRRAHRKALAQAWSRRLHEHRWRAISTVVHQTETREILSIVTEECRRCPAMRLVVMPGTWGINRFGELVNVTAEDSGLRAML